MNNIIKKTKLAIIAVFLFLVFNTFYVGAEDVQPLDYTKDKYGFEIIDNVVYDKMINGENSYYRVVDFAPNQATADKISAIRIVNDIDGVPVKEIFNESENRFKCPNIYELIIPENIVIIGPHSFKGLINLKKITLPKNLEVIGERAFSNLKNLDSIKIPKKVTEIKEWTFYNCTNLSEVVFEGDIKVIGLRAFQKCTSIKNINLPDTLVQIGSYAFEGCKNIEEIELPNSLRYIYYGAFSNTSLEEILIPSAVELELRGVGPFYNCKKLKKVIFEDIDAEKRGSSVVNISEKAFENCTSLETVILPSNTDKVVIGSRSFKNCNKLKNIYNSENIYSIGEAAFAFCDSLKSFNISENIKTQPFYGLSDKAFYNCKNLKTVIFEAPESSDGITIPQKCFDGCINLKKIYLPEDCQITIKERAFRNCNNLSKIYGTENISAIGEAAFAFCYELKAMKFSSVLTSVDKKAFSGCTKLEKISFDGAKVVPSFGKNSFASTKSGIKFITDNSSFAKSIAKSLKDTGVKNAKIYKISYVAVS